MKKFSLVLLLLVVASLAYSVGGSLYMRYDSTGSVVATEWGLLDDLRVGRRGTGFDLNFDAFTLSYKLRSSVDAGGWQMDGSLGDISSALGGTVTLTSPGYIQLSGLKLGPANASVGLAWWHYDYSFSSKSEPTSGTAVEAKASAGANIIGLDFAFDLPIGDSMRLHIDPWDKADFYIGFGDADVKNPSTPATNVASSFYFKTILPLHFNMNFDVVGVEIFPKITFVNKSGKYSLSSGETNDNNSTSLTFGIMARVNVAINELLGAFAHVGFVYMDSFGIVNSTTSGTNTNGTTEMEAPIFAGITVKPAGPILLTLGVGYLAELGVTYKAPVATTNQPAGGLIGEYGYFDEHGYKNPFLRFAGSAKFASDWEIGMSTILYWNQSAIATQGGSGNYYSGAVVKGSTGTATFYSMELFHFDYFNHWDGGGNGFGANYIQFSKDNVTIRGNLGDGTGLFGAFGFIDVSFAF